MQYLVPQFIEVEDKLVGPMTLRQFGYVALAFFIAYFSFYLLQFYVWLVFCACIDGFLLALAFLKYNGRYVGQTLRAAFNYYWRPRLYLWQKKTPGKGGGRGVSDLALKLSVTSEPLAREKSFIEPFIDRLRGLQEKYEVFQKNTGEREAARRIDYR